MPFKHLEHDGGEDFSTNSQNRHQVKERDELLAKEDKDKELEKKERLQREYMNPNNEALWEEFDW